VCLAVSDLLTPNWKQSPGDETDVLALRQDLMEKANLQEELADKDAETTKQALTVMELGYSRDRENTVSPENRDSVALRLHRNVIGGSR